MSDRKAKFLVVIGLVALGALVVLQLLVRPGVSSVSTSPGPGTSKPPSTSTSTTTTPPDQTIAATVPINDHGGKSTVSVAIPQNIVDKLGTPNDAGKSTPPEALWTGLAALLGAVIGGGVSLMVNGQNNKRGQQASDEGRRWIIRDRSFNAFAEAIQKGRLAADEGEILWRAMFDGAKTAYVRKISADFEALYRDWFTAAIVAELAIPTAAEPAHKAYQEKLSEFISAVYNWMEDYLAGASLSDDEVVDRRDNCTNLLEAVQTLRLKAVEEARSAFHAPQ